MTCSSSAPVSLSLALSSVVPIGVGGIAFGTFFAAIGSGGEGANIGLGVVGLDVGVLGVAVDAIGAGGVDIGLGVVGLDVGVLGVAIDAIGAGGVDNGLGVVGLDVGDLGVTVGHAEELRRSLELDSSLELAGRGSRRLPRR